MSESFDRYDVVNVFEERLEQPGLYRNYGDANPDIHGGLWAAYEDHHWDIVETVHPHVMETDYPEDTPGHQYVLVGEAYLDEVVGPDGEWTGQFESIPDKYSPGYADPLGAAVDGQLTHLVAAEVRTSMIEPHREVHPYTKESYDAILDAMGVTPRE